MTIGQSLKGRLVSGARTGEERRLIDISHCTVLTPSHSLLLSPAILGLSERFKRFVALNLIVVYRVASLRARMPLASVLCNGKIEAPRPASSWRHPLNLTDELPNARGCAAQK